MKEGKEELKKISDKAKDPAFKKAIDKKIKSIDKDVKK